MPDDAARGALPAGVPTPERAAVAGDADKLKVFISYSRKDALDFAQQLKCGLEVCGHEPLLDVHGIAGGEDWRRRLLALILEADTVVFVLTPESAASEVCAWEVEQTLVRAKRLLPVAAKPLGDVKPPAALGTLNYIHFYPEKSVPGSGFGQGLQRLATSLAVDPEWIREHTRLTALAESWIAQRKAGAAADDALLIGKSIDLAEAWLAARPANAPESPAIVVELIRASRAAADARVQAERRQLAEMRAAQEAREVALAEREAAQKREAEASRRAEAEAKAREMAQAREAEAARRASRVTLAGLAASLVLLVLAGFQWWRADGETVRAATNETRALAEAVQARLAREAAAKAEQAAVASRNRALLKQSQFLADLAAKETAEGNAATGLLLALEALPDAKSDDADTRERSYWAPAEASLEGARRMLRERLVLKGHTDRVTSVAVTPDGARIVTGSYDNTARLWDARTGAAVGGPFKGHTDFVSSVAVMPDGTRIVTGSHDGTARLWELFPPAPALIEDARDHAPRCLTPGERQRYYLDPAPPRWCGSMQKWPYDDVGAVIDSVRRLEPFVPHRTSRVGRARRARRPRLQPRSAAMNDGHEVHPWRISWMLR